ncbi:hypothetical protein LSAT2_026889 [Lamellibrachia satsuma]|nr:hypothetical protein LSAT2_026889 [Lamellibrachia satsuma]
MFGTVFFCTLVPIACALLSGLVASQSTGRDYTDACGDESLKLRLLDSMERLHQQVVNQEEAIRSIERQERSMSLDSDEYVARMRMCRTKSIQLRILPFTKPAPSSNHIDLQTYCCRATM